jgi:aryl-alcohol dehydrogenase-like predicted oxidoreductase/predicted kinase
MRLSTDPGRDDVRAIQVIHAALDVGIRLLDTADVYARDEDDVGHNERLIAGALRHWDGDSSRVQLATKGGLTRVGRRWAADGRAKHLRAACDASRLALDRATIDLYQLHAVDPKTTLSTSVRALAALQRQGKIREVGLCNVTVEQIEAARQITEIASVQVSVSVYDLDNLRNGVAAYCRDHGIRLLAYRPLAGDRRAGLLKDPVLGAIAAAHDATPFEIALAWLMDLDRSIEPVVGVTHVETLRSIQRAATIQLTDEDREHLDAHLPAGRLLRITTAQRRPSTSAEGEVVLVMGTPGAGKSTIAREWVARGYERLNRDSLGGRARLRDLLQPLDAGLSAGQRRWVLDNTYPTRESRNSVIECAWRHGIPVRCIWLTTSREDAQINAVSRLVAAHGHLPSPEELHKHAATDPTAFGPDAQFRYDRIFEAPVVDEGFASVEQIPFRRKVDARATERAVLLEFDGVLCTSVDGATVPLEPASIVILDDRREILTRYHREGWIVGAIAWRPQAHGDPDVTHAVEACFDRVRELLGLAIDLAYCPHPAGRPVCWCRKPLPGLAIQLFSTHHVAAHQSIMVGRTPADRTLSRRLGMTYRDAADFFARPS